MHVAIDDATRLAYVEVLADEQQATAIGFLSRAVAWFNGHGMECRQVMSDNGPAYLSRSLQGLQSPRPQASAPGLHARTNGNVELGLRPTASTSDLVPEWAYAMAFQNSGTRQLPRYLSIYNWLRKHSALGGRSPQRRLNEPLR